MGANDYTTTLIAVLHEWQSAAVAVIVWAVAVSAVRLIVGMIRGAVRG